MADTRRLAPRWRRLLLTTHVGASVGLLGTDATVVLLAVTGARGADPAHVYPAAELIGSLLLVPAALLSLLTGVLMGLLTPWGLFRHWWVTVKLVLTSAGAVLSLVVLTPALAGLADATGPIPLGPRLELVRDSGAASLVLLGTLVLSVYKPFGRIRAAVRAGSGRAPSPPAPPTAQPRPPAATRPATAPEPATGR